MSTIAIASAKGSPGTTTAAVALGATWPQDVRVVVVEADPFGGDLAPRFGLAATPGLGSLATEARRFYDPEILWHHTQELPGGLAVVAAPSAPEQTQVALGLLTPDFFARTSSVALGPEISDLASGIDTTTHIDVALLDVGRVDMASPSWPLLTRANLVMLCARPILAEIHHLVAAIDTLHRNHLDVVIVLIGDGPYSSAEIEEVTETEVIGHLPFDRHGAAALSGAGTSRRMLDHSPLLRSARALSQTISVRLRTNAPLAVVEPQSLGTQLPESQSADPQPTEAVS